MSVRAGIRAGGPDSLARLVVKLLDNLSATEEGPLETLRDTRVMAHRYRVSVSIPCMQLGTRYAQRSFATVSSEMPSSK